MKNIVVVGLGEMGASLAKILNKEPKNQVIGVDINEKSLSYAKDHGIVFGAASNLVNVASHADVIILATPVTYIEEMIRSLSQLSLKKEVIVTDTGSTKRDIMDVAEAVLTPKNIHFVGGHAMAGTHRSGVEWANEKLYQDVPYFLIPSSISNARRLQEILEPIAAKFMPISVKKHDELMAVISDIPHIMSFALMNTATNQLGDSTTFGQYVAGGFKDMTRIAESDPKLWTDVLLSNKEAILTSQSLIIEQLQLFSQAIEDNDASTLMTLISSAQESRKNLLLK
ncbi:prephenate dehydrogenase [Leuconostoc mesenteroides]|mgnify:FL=1|uniref:Prephenate dehydrogenase n=1 Tax=Leuconostoc mesenteroides subsp. mesenteroides (strain ATCC 8293 / DSM 20343 / BCRC 11652 / CCM 1803 / JCM 6124 / NCDO 523 / NBRC 100496 / NCIMB 8023 / NCTC 12954 / NRRL B-1118 / 37Y) TaxID=203120 RepID=Q03X11_LEUMM|nr:prephenate dehydrogenase/arogenate dehydrogenase family protein [Leuconostoc mesenteroides]ABJ62261.1 prephenate dehydrogenase [Leuconostoc mesenteroides subsp. mesenteroides ATCC 8293]ARN63614.1 prephenate dehydrogenase [Leuconostoc mesenteroides subsp. mesenteroides]MCT3042949.1 prephenate dehydrogenase/arogenate dehydrogenase family protein [Leuconostoc mesenteroides]MCT8385960.1 prephenate dehydrogenase/arogenate dehydrogenase family protein [Leuconostoc mesenteroides]MDG9747325.1 preph